MKKTITININILKKVTLRGFFADISMYDIQCIEHGIKHLLKNILMLEDNKKLKMNER